jgi:hypothetical protein
MMLNDLIREEAKKNVGRYNFVADKEMKIKHHVICKKLVELADKHNFPMTLMLYIAVGTNAHRKPVFERGYNYINLDKVEQVVKLADVFAKKFGNKARTNDKVIHLISRYYDIMGGKPLMFKQFCNNVNKSEFNIKSFNQSKELAKAIFGKYAVYSKGGYFTDINKM